MIDFIDKELSIFQALLSTITSSSCNLENPTSDWPDVIATWFGRIRRSESEHACCSGFGSNASGAFEMLGIQ